MAWEIKHRMSKNVIMGGDGELKDAYLNGAYLKDANLGGANLSGANLGGTCVIDIGQRNDGFQFYLQLRPERKGDEPLVLAGCRYFPISEARRHWEETRGGTQLGDESQALLDHGERMVSIRQRKEKSDDRLAAN